MKPTNAISPSMTLRSEAGVKIEVSVCRVCGAAILDAGDAVAGDVAALHLEWHRRLNNVERAVTDPWPGAAAAALRRLGQDA